MESILTRSQCLELDRQDTLAPLRSFFNLPSGEIYFNGNSLGPLPRATTDRLLGLISQEWGVDLIRSWNKFGWIDMPQVVGNKIARLVGAGQNELIVADSTSVNLYKVLYSALTRQQGMRKGRHVVLTEADNFPSDIYIAQSVCQDCGAELRLLDDPDRIESALDDQVSVLMLTQVNYRSAYLHDMQRLTGLAHEAGALTIWDLAHSAGALPVNLLESNADYAVGCGYKFLCGGPGAPAFVWINPRLADQSRNPLRGWLSHTEPFRFTASYIPAQGIGSFQCGTPPILALAALECGVDALLSAEALGGMERIKQKGQLLAEQLINGIKDLEMDYGVSLVSPEAPQKRGSQISLSLDGPLTGAGYSVMQALIARGVTGDFRSGDSKRNDRPDILRFGITPLTLRHVDIHDALGHFRQVLDKEEWRSTLYQKIEKVT